MAELTPRVRKIDLQADKRQLAITWADGELNRYHYVWLRHSGRCSNGMPNDTRVKIDLLPEDPATLAIDDCALDGDSLVIDWRDDGLQTRHGLATLRRAAYDDAARQRRKHCPKLWDRDSARHIPQFEFNELSSHNRLLQLLIAVRDYGVAKLRNLPTDPGSIAEIATAFGPLHVNNYGRIFDVKSDARMNLGSNTGHYLPPHTDESYRHDAPGISFFHCLEAAPAGGESILVDGFRAAEILRHSDQESFKILTEVPILFQRYALPQEDMRSHTRVLVLDIDGDVVGVRWTDRTLPPQDLPPRLVEPVYRAIRHFWDIVSLPEVQHVYSMQAGDLHVFDNHRVLHGRLAFDPAAGSRHLQQCSVNRDEFHNSLRVLAARLENPASELIMAGGALG